MNYIGGYMMNCNVYDIAKFIATYRDDLEPVYLSVEDFEEIRRLCYNNVLDLSPRFAYMVQDETYKNLFKAYIKMPIERVLIRYPDFDDVDDKYDLLLKNREGFKTVLKGYNEMVVQVADILEKMRLSHDTGD